MARFFDIFPRLNRSQLDRDLRRLQNERHNINVNANVDGGNNVNNLNNSINDLNHTGRDSSKIFSDLRLKMGAYLAITTAVRDAIRGSIKTIKSYDGYITDLANAMGGTREEAEKYLIALSEQGKQLKATVGEMAEGADSFARQGKTIAETETLITNSMILSKVAKMSSADSTDTLTSAMNSFNLSAEETIEIVDKLTSVDLVSASSADGLSISLGKSAGAAKLASMSIDKLISSLAVMKEAAPMESDESIGNAMKSILSRMNQVKAGVFVDAETGEALNDVEKVLSQVSISMRDANGQFLSSEKILDEVGQKWSSFDSVTQRAVATAIAGSYQYSRFLNLMDGYSKVLEYTTVAQNSSGQAMEKFQNYEESLEAKTKLLQNSLESLAYSTFGNEFYGSVLDATTGLIQFAEKTEAVKVGLTALGIVSSAKLFTAISSSIVGAVKNLSDFNTALNIVKSADFVATDFDALLRYTNGLRDSQLKLVLSSQLLNEQQRMSILTSRGMSIEQAKATLTTYGLSTSQATATASTRGFSSAIKGLGASIKGLASSHPILLAITAVAGVVYGTVKAYDALTISVEEANEAMNEAVSNYETTKSELESINAELTEHQKALDELLAKEKLTYAEQGQLEELQAITKELQLQQDIASKKAEKESKEVAEKAVDAYETQYGNIDATKSGVIDSFGLINETGGHVINASKDDIPAQIANYVTFNKEAEKLRNKLAESKDLTEEEYNSLVNSAEKYEEIANKSEGNLTDSLQDLVDKRANLQEEYNKAIESQKNGELLTTSQKDIISTYEEISNAIKLIYEYTDKNKWNEMQIDAVFNAEDIEVTKEQLIEMAKAGTLDEDTIKSYVNLNNAINNMDLIGNKSLMRAFLNEIFASAEIADEATVSFDKTSKSLADLLSQEDYAETKESLMELAKSGELTPETLTSTRAYRDLLTETGLSAKLAIKEINQIASETIDFSDWQTQLENARSSMSDLQSILDDMDENEGELSVGSIDKIISSYPTLLNYMDDTAKLQEEINSLIDQESRVAQNAANMMLDYNTQVYSSILASTQDLMNGITICVEGETYDLTTFLSESYGTDLKNFTNLAQAKEKIESDLIRNMSTNWATYYGVVVDAVTGLAEITKNQFDFYQNTPEAIEAQNQMAAHNELITRLNAAKSNFENISIEDIGKVKDPDDKKKEKDSSKQYDWIEILLDKTSKATEKLKKKFEDAFSLTTAKLAFKKAINQITKEIKTNEKAVKKYDDLANKVGLSKEYRQKVDNGTLNIETIKDEKLQKKIELYQEYKEKADACRETIEELRDSYAELADTFYSKPLEKRDDNLEGIDTDLQLLDSKIENAKSSTERNKYAKQRENLYDKEFKEHATASKRANNNFDEAKKNIDKTSDKALKGLTKNQKKKIVDAVKAGKEITDEVIDFSTLTEEALQAVANYNASLVKKNEAYDSKKQAYEDRKKNKRENKQVKIDSASDKLDLYRSDYENINEDNWEARNKNLDKQIKMTMTYYDLMIQKENDVVRKEQLRAEKNKEINNLIKEQIQNIKDYNDRLGSIQSSAKNTRASVQTFYEASGMDTTATRVENYQYQSQMALNEAMVNLSNASLADLSTTEGQQEYWSYMGNYWSLMAEHNKAQYDKWYEETISGVNTAIENVSREAEKLNQSLELNETKGIDKDESDYTALINKESEAISKNEEKIAKLKQKQQEYLAIGGSVESIIYKDMQSEIDECENSIHDAKKTQIEYNNALANLPIERLEKELDLLDSIGNRLESENDLAEKQGKDLSVEDYQREIDNQKTTASTMQEKANIAYQNMLKAMSSSDGVYGGKTIKEWETDFNNFQAEALKAESAVIDLKKEMRDDVFWRDYNRKMDILGHKSQMLSDVGDLISDKMKFDSDGKLTDLGRTSIAIDVANLENSQAQVEETTAKIQELQRLREEGYYPDEDEFNEKMQELQNTLIDATKNTMSYRDAIVDMATAMAENELNALNKIIDKRKKALQAKKSYYDYDKNLRNQNKEIEALESEIAAMQGVEDSYVKSELARKQAELDELKEARDDTIIEHSYEVRSNGLDELQEDLQTKYDEYIDGIGRNFESIEEIVGKAKGIFANSFNEIGNHMYELLQNYGVDPNATGIKWSYVSNVEDTKGFATGGIIRSNYTKMDDKLLVRVNPNETILTQKFTDMLPDAVKAMSNFNVLQPTIPQPVIPNFKGNTGNSTTNIDTLIRVDGNVDKTVVGDLKELANDLAKKTNLLDKSYQYTTSALTKEARAMGIKRVIR